MAHEPDIMPQYKSFVLQKYKKYWYLQIYL